MLIQDINNTRAALAALANPEAHISFSQFGEDLVLLAFLRNRKRLDRGFYIDVGAFHPFRYSNTALLHLFYGWRGVNIDANPEAIRSFATNRPGDINIEAAVSDMETEAEYVMFDRGAINSLDPAMIERQLSAPNTPFKVADRVTVRTQRLDHILEGIPTLPGKIDLLSVDCEGLDHRVLISNDWDRYRPFIILVECHGFDLRRPMNNASYSLLTEKGYRLISHVFVTSIYIDDRAR